MRRHDTVVLQDVILLCAICLSQLVYLEALGSGYGHASGGASVSLGGCTLNAKGSASTGKLGGSGSVPTNCGKKGALPSGKRAPTTPKQKEVTTTPAPLMTTPAPVTTQAALIPKPPPGEEIPGVSSGDANYTRNHGLQTGGGNFDLSKIAQFKYNCSYCFLINDFSKKESWCPDGQTTICDSQSEDGDPYCVVSTAYMKLDSTRFKTYYYKGCSAGCLNSGSRYGGDNGTYPYYCHQCIGTMCNDRDFIVLPGPIRMDSPNIK